MVEKITKNTHIAQVVMTKKRLIFYTYSLLLALVLLISGFALSSPNLPASSEEIHFYSNQMGDDLRLIFTEALAKATHDIDISIFNFSDRKLLSTLLALQKSGRHINILADRSAFSSLHRLFPKTSLYPCLDGLMHRKILSIDHSLLIIGSANFTRESLQIHENLLIALQSHSLAASLAHNRGGGKVFLFPGQTAELWLLPEDRQAEKRLLELIDTAKKSLQIAMFTWTSERFTKAVIAAHKRGVDVQVALDRKSAKGTSRKIAHLLMGAGIPLFHNTGSGLLHHKFCLIDGHTFISGSTNWTVSAFTRNAEIVLILHPLTSHQEKFLSKLWTILTLPSKRGNAVDCELDQAVAS